jgi:glycosyltransferase involved in cell wall biosynthesis
VVTPRVSVVIAARDASETIVATLASVRAQTVEDWEVVLVDDGSTDATADIAREASIDRLRVIRHQVAQGPGAARNRAIREARGELIAVLDADDAWRPRYLESQLGVYDDAVGLGRRVGAVCCDAELVGPDGPTGIRWSDRVGRADVVDVETMLGENVVFGLVLGPRSVFLALGGYEEDDRIHLEDYDLWLRMLENDWEIVTNPETLAVYRLGDVSRSSATERMGQGGSMIISRALERGALTPAQRRLARKRRRMYEVVRRRALIAADPVPARRMLAMVGAAPVIVVSALEHPERWRHWLREGPRSAGDRRHAG